MQPLNFNVGSRMSRLRLVILLVLICTHAMLIVLGNRLPDVIAPAVAGTVYGPLWLLNSIGLPVFGRAASGGWAEPDVLGWFLVAAIWITLWWVLVAAVARLRA